MNSFREVHRVFECLLAAAAIATATRARAMAASLKLCRSTISPTNFHNSRGGSLPRDGPDCHHDRGRFRASLLLPFVSGSTASHLNFLHFYDTLQPA